jgi:probable rRNA maturation factor
MIVQQIAVTLDRQEVTAVSKDLPLAARLTLQSAGVPLETGLTILITSDEQVRDLNRQFLGIDSATDVLSFTAGETDPDSGELYLGDVIVSYPRAQAQAQAGGHPVAEELELLVVHGILHLIGYDHAGPDAKRRMWQLQGAILDQLGTSVRPPDEHLY